VIKEFTGEIERNYSDVIIANYEHGNIVDKLKLTLEKKGFQVGNDTRDLFVVENEEITKIFEVKTDTTSSIQKGIGQLIQYSVELPKQPTLYLVLPESLDQTIQKYLKQKVGIDIIVFKKKNDVIEFQELDNIVKSW